VKSTATRAFWKCFEDLPPTVQRAARDAYAQWSTDPWHPGLNFKRVHLRLPIWSVRIGLHWRALGKRADDQVTWFWIGSHADYDRLISKG
jgi:hypothetical protein